MGHWNYRVMSRDGELAIYEVHYDEGGRVVGYSAAPCFPAGETLEALKANCEQYLAALEAPVLSQADRLQAD